MSARARHSERGKTARKSGQDFEDHLERIHEVYDAGRIARVWKIGSRMVPVRTEMGILWRVTGKARNDFMGVFGENFAGGRFFGKTFRFEAKSKLGNKRKSDGVRTPIASIPMDDWGIQIDQIDELLDYARRYDAMVFVLWMNARKMGIMGNDGLAQVKKQHDSLGMNRIKRDMFHWLPMLETDYLGYIERQIMEATE